MKGLLAGAVSGGIAISLTLAALHAQTTVAPTNNLPNPYQTVENYFKMPEGRTWGATSAVAVDKDGKSIWIAERCGANSCAGSTLPSILHFAADGTLIKAFGEGMLLSPHGIYVDADDNIWVVDCACTGTGGRRSPSPNDATQMVRQVIDPVPPSAQTPPPPIGHQIFKFTPDGRLLLTLGKAGGAREPDFFYQPNNLVIAKDGTIIVAEGHASTPGSTARVMTFTKDGKLIRSFGKLGTGPDEFDQPHALAFDSKGRLFVGDRNNNRIQIFDRNFKLLDTWTQFSRPSGIYIDKNDVIYVADSESESVSRNHDGWKRGIRVGSAKDGSVKYFIPDPVDKATNTSAAEGVTADPAGNIYGAEVGPRAVKKYVKKTDLDWFQDAQMRRVPGMPTIAVPGGCVPPSPQRRADPKYTSAAMAHHLQGDIEVAALVGEQGDVLAARVTKSHDSKYGLDAAAIAAAKGWHFTPATCGGQVTQMIVGLIIEFRYHGL